MTFVPKHVIFEPEALKFERGQRVLEIVRSKGIPVDIAKSHNRITAIPGTGREGFVNAKNTMVVGVRRGLKFATCKPSAHFQLPITTSCPGMCEYCYLHTTLGAKPYLRVYVNIEEILAQAKLEIEKREGEVTIFEGAATSDPIPTEPYTGALQACIEFFASEPLGRFRFVTKFTDVDSLIHLKHNGHTRFRFSINADHVIDRFEHRTPRLGARLEAAGKVGSAEFPLGFIIGPIMEFEGWKVQYEDMLDRVFENLSEVPDLHFELITHRFTARAKQNISAIFPESELEMDEKSRKYKYGQFGYGKYVYEKDTMSDMKSFFEEQITKRFPAAIIDYFV